MHKSTMQLLLPGTITVSLLLQYSCSIFASYATRPFRTSSVSLNRLVLDTRALAACPRRGIIPDWRQDSGLWDWPHCLEV